MDWGFCFLWVPFVDAHISRSGPDAARRSCHQRPDRCDGREARAFCCLRHPGPEPSDPNPKPLSHPLPTASRSNVDLESWTRHNPGVKEHACLDRAILPHRLESLNASLSLCELQHAGVLGDAFGTQACASGTHECGRRLCSTATRQAHSGRALWQKYGGASVPSALLTRCCSLAVERAAELDHVVNLSSAVMVVASAW